MKGEEVNHTATLSDLLEAAGGVMVLTPRRRLVRDNRMSDSGCRLAPAIDDLSCEIFEIPELEAGNSERQFDGEGNSGVSLRGFLSYS